MPPKRMIVVTRNGETQVVSGWRAWLIAIGSLLFAWLVLALAIVFLAGIAVTVGVVLLLLIPAVALVVLIASVRGQRR